MLLGVELPDDALWFLGNLVILRLRGAATGGKTCVVEVHGPPGDTVPWHVHTRDHELFGVLEGRVTFRQPGRAIDLQAGMFYFALRNIPHTYVVDGQEPARWLAINTPGGFDDFMAAFGEPARARSLPPSTLADAVDKDKLALVAARFGIEMLYDASFP